MKYYFLILMNMFVLISCKSDQINELSLKEKVYSSGDTSILITKNGKELFEFSSSESENLKYVLLKTEANQIQVLNFYTDGLLQSKVMMTDSFIVDGLCYYFNPQTGALSALNQYKNGRLHGIQKDFYDGGNDSLVKDYDNGKCIGRLLLDKHNEAIEVSGSFIVK